MFCDQSVVERYVEVEVALAKAEASVGLIPVAAAQEIAARSNAAAIDLARLKAETDIVGYPIVGVVHQMAKQCGDAGRYVHWGATTQDIMDTATVLQMRDALALDRNRSCSHRGGLGASRTQASRHRDGRPHASPARAAGDVRLQGGRLAVDDPPASRAARRNCARACWSAQFSGAAGTLASLGADGLKVQAALAEELGLRQPDITWHAARDGIAEAACVLGLVTGSLSKIAVDVMLMMQTEIGEAFEPFVPGRGSSSTMPQKRNPISCEMIVALAKAVRSSVGLMLDGMAADHERATGPWHLEWMAVPEMFIASAGALYQARFMLEGLIVEPAAMQRNLDVTGGLIVAEAVMMALAPHIGRGAAHDVVYACCRAALDKDTPLLVQLEAHAVITKHFDAAGLARLVDPANYLGTAREMVDRLVGGSSIG